MRVKSWDDVRCALAVFSSLLNQCYDRGRHDRIDYRRDPDYPLSAQEAIWVDHLLRSKGLR